MAKMKQVVKISNSLSSAQRREMALKLQALIKKFETLANRRNGTSLDYFYGVADGLNNACKLIMQENDDYNDADYLGHLLDDRSSITPRN